MMKTTRIVAAGLVVTGIVEIVVWGADTSLWAWRLLFVHWMVALLTRFTLAGVDAYRAVFAKGSNGEMTFPEFEQKMASFRQGSNRKESGPSSRSTSGTGSQDGTDDLFDDFRFNPIIREDDPFGLFFGD